MAANSPLRGRSARESVLERHQEHPDHLSLPYSADHPPPSTRPSCGNNRIGGLSLAIVVPSCSRIGHLPDPRRLRRPSGGKTPRPLNPPTRFQISGLASRAMVRPPTSGRRGTHCHSAIPATRSGERSCASPGSQPNGRRMRVNNSTHSATERRFWKTHPRRARLTCLGCAEQPPLR